MHCTLGICSSRLFGRRHGFDPQQGPRCAWRRCSRWPASSSRPASLPKTTRGIPKNTDLLGKPLEMWMSFLANKINLAMSYPSEYQLAKKSFQLGLALLQEPSNTIIYCKTFWPLTTPQSSHSSFLFRINHNNSST